MERLEYDKALLCERIQRRMTEPGSFATAIGGVGLHRRDKPNFPENCFLAPKIVKMVQGRKRSVIGADEYFYDEDNLFIAGVDMPNTSNIMDATPDKPCMSITVDLDKNLIAQLAMEMPEPISESDDAATGLLIQPVDAEMLNAFLRLEALLDKPTHISVLAPMLIKEIHFRVLCGPGGERLRLFYTYGSQKNQIARAIAWLRENFRERLTVDELAGKVHMAPSTFHRHFKEITSVSPLQFQKRLRLHEAQRLMLIEDLDAGRACEAVGYESLTQFNREYKRHFGEPPRRNVTRWQRDHAETPAVLPGV